jgi:hypothetical protein
MDPASRNRTQFDATSSVSTMPIMTKHPPVEQRKRAVKTVLDHLDEYRSVYAACQVIGPKVDVGLRVAAPVGLAYLTHE